MRERLSTLISFKVYEDYKMSLSIWRYIGTQSILISSFEHFHIKDYANNLVKRTTVRKISIFYVFQINMPAEMVLKFLQKYFTPSINSPKYHVHDNSNSLLFCFFLKFELKTNLPVFFFWKLMTVLTMRYVPERIFSILNILEQQLTSRKMLYGRIVYL